MAQGAGGCRFGDRVDRPAIVAGIRVVQDEPPPAHQERGLTAEGGGADHGVDTALVHGGPELGGRELVVRVRREAYPSRSEKAVVVVEQIDDHAHVVRVFGDQRQVHLLGGVEVTVLRERLGTVGGRPPARGEPVGRVPGRHGEEKHARDEGNEGVRAEKAGGTHARQP